MSYKITHFSDANTFVVINSIVCYNYPGKSYLEKLKNGLSLDSVIRSQFRVESIALSRTYIKYIEDKNKEKNKEKNKYIEERFFDFSPPYLRKYNSKKSKRNNSKNNVQKRNTNKKKSKLNRSLESDLKIYNQTIYHLYEDCNYYKQYNDYKQYNECSCDVCEKDRIEYYEYRI